MATCGVCKGALSVGGTNPTFSAECSHSFHYHCINGNQNCPVCQAEIKNIPPISPVTSYPPVPSYPSVYPSYPPVYPSYQPAYPSYSPFYDPSLYQPFSPPVVRPSEPLVFNDDDPIVLESKVSSDDTSTIRSIEVNTHIEFPAVSRSSSKENFHILVNLKSHVTDDQASRAPIDLVTVLDVSGSMYGQNIELLQQAMRFVINNLGPSDRLSVISFSDDASRLFPLIRMTESGKQRAIQAVNSLDADGNTNIIEGLKKGTKVIEDRKHKNPVYSIMLLSDGEDTKAKTINCTEISKVQIPVHTFGFGTDHDPIMLHSISESSKGTFSFIESEGFIQDAFAQCIGGLLSVAVQDLQVHIQSLDSNLCLGQLKAGSYSTNLTGDNQTGSVNIGDMYADEERDFLVLVNIPVIADGNVSDPMRLFSVWCSYKDPFKKESVTTEAIEVKLPRPETIDEDMVASIEVDRQKNRLQAAEAMNNSRAAAERGDLRRARSIIDDFREDMLHNMHDGDDFSGNLALELKEVGSRMEDEEVYASTGRGLLYAGLSSHSRQQATFGFASSGPVMFASASCAGAPAQACSGNAYKTPAMDRMVNLSRASQPKRRPTDNTNKE